MEGCVAVAKLSEKARLLAHRLPQGRGVLAPASRPRSPGFVPAKAVGTFVPRLTQKAFEKYGFSAATLLTDWAAIVGLAMARDTRPERLKWPRSVEVYGETADDATGRPGATLVLQVDPARALEIEYKRAQILDRINSYFGYRAVVEIRVVQHSVAIGQRPAQQEPGRSTAAPAAPSLSNGLSLDGIDDGLRAALERMHAGVAARQPKDTNR